jgi:hypothetical protein
MESVVARLASQKGKFRLPPTKLRRVAFRLDQETDLFQAWMPLALRFGARFQ